MQAANIAGIAMKVLQLRLVSSIPGAETSAKSVSDGVIVRRDSKPEAERSDATGQQNRKDRVDD